MNHTQLLTQILSTLQFTRPQARGIMSLIEQGLVDDRQTQEFIVVIEQGMESSKHSLSQQQYQQAQHLIQQIKQQEQSEDNNVEQLLSSI